MPAPIQKSAASTKAATQVITANRLSDGVVVYLDAVGAWTERVGRARVVEGEDALAAAVATAKASEADQIVLDAYPIDVARDGSGLQPLRLRERIRAAGPTSREDLLRPVGA